MLTGFHLRTAPTSPPDPLLSIAAPRPAQDAGAALTPLSDAELSLALLLRDGGRKGWLSFRDWAHWWAGRQPWDEQGAAGGQQGEDRQLQQQ